MITSSRALGVAGLFVVALAVVGCSGAGLDPELSLSAKPRTIDNHGAKSVITVTATDSSGKVGTGTVRVTSAVGSLTAGTQVTLADGKADVDFTCDVAVDTGCVPGSVRITGEWVTNSKLAQGLTSVTLTVPGVDAGSDAGADAGRDGGGGGGGSTGGGAGGGGGSLDAGLVLTSDKPRIFTSVGDFATVTGLLTVGGTAVPDASVTLSASLGALSQTDGGSAGASLALTTDSAGKVFARFNEGNGTTGTANLTGVSTMPAAMGALSIDIGAVNSIVHVVTACGATSPCSIMGIRGSGFNENATVKFKVVDAMAKPVPGIRVTFSIVNPPVGTNVSMMDTSNALGEVTATVSAGPTIGAFNVKAVVIPGMVESVSPTIGIRGAKPSNNGFQLQCERVNIPAYVSATPPKQISVNCTVTLVDRYGNPVGTGTSVGLKSEAGTVPSSIQTIAFMPSGANPNEGTGTFTFQTAGVFPAQDVPPLAAAPGQYPFPRAAEPSRMDSALTRNPRDSLVTIIAYVRGEEHFYDDNNNGVRDANERFIDQGEPFVDQNDNNQWDPGEVYIDESPADGQWNPPNGQWDGNVTVWTITHILYTGETLPNPSYTFFTPATFNVAKTTNTLLDVYAPDLNLNRAPAGSTFGVMTVGTKGTATVVADNSALDDYGFVLNRRALTNAAGTGPCDASTPICQFRTLIGTWGSGFVGKVRVDGAASTDMTPAANLTVNGTRTVQSIATTFSAVGTIQ